MANQDTDIYVEGVLRERGEAEVLALQPRVYEDGGFAEGGHGLYEADRADELAPLWASCELVPREFALADGAAGSDSEDESRPVRAVTALAMEGILARSDESDQKRSAFDYSLDRGLGAAGTAPKRLFLVDLHDLLPPLRDANTNEIKLDMRQRVKHLDLTLDMLRKMQLFLGDVVLYVPPAAGVSRKTLLRHFYEF